MDYQALLQAVDHWKEEAKRYEWMFLEQKEMCDGYREVIQELEQHIRALQLNKFVDKNDV